MTTVNNQNLLKQIAKLNLDVLRLNRALARSDCHNEQLHRMLNIAQREIEARDEKIVDLSQEIIQREAENNDLNEMLRIQLQLSESSSSSSNFDHEYVADETSNEQEVLEVEDSDNNEPEYDTAELWKLEPIVVIEEGDGIYIPPSN